MPPTSEARYVIGDSPIWGNESDRILGEIEQKLRRTSSDPSGDIRSLKDDASRVFKRCADPRAEPESSSQLVVGRVQAGKTSNFTVVTGLARDNGYQLFIVIAGTKTELLTQTLGRLSKVLGGHTASTLPAFWVRKLSTGNEDSLNAFAAQVRTKLDALRSSPSGVGQAAVIVVLKEDDNLRSLAVVLEKLGNWIPLDTVPTLVIDDEADQASPDGRVRNPASSSTAIHNGIADVRRLLPWHTFLAYTATPQANLLMELKGLLHPRFVTVIDAGKDYVGVEELFGSNSKVRFACEVLDTPPPPGVAPESLKRSIATFLVQIVMVREYRTSVLREPLRSSQDPICVTMLVNPAMEVSEHATWRELIDTVFDSWGSQFGDLDDLGTVRIVDDFIRPAWRELRESLNSEGIGFECPDEPSRSDLEMLGRLIPYVERRTINSRTAQAGVRLPSDDEWNQSVAWVFVGGEILGRGQTLNNLMTTYMPRPAGVGAIDTLQQRGRFYGYHGSYLPLLRGWFEPNALALYNDAANSESALLASLSDVDRSEMPLSEWTRAFLLGRGRLKATRANVIPRSVRTFSTTKWAFTQNYLVDEEINRANEDVLAGILQDPAIEPVLWPNEVRTDRCNYTFQLSMDRFLELLNSWNVDLPEIQRLADLSLVLSRVDEQVAGEKVTVVLMDRLSGRPKQLTETSYRSLKGSSSGIVDRRQIGNAVGQSQRQVVDVNCVTAQIHMFRIGTARDERQAQIVVDHAPSLVVWLPEDLRHRVLTFDPGD